MAPKGLVCGGGGVAGVAWMTGLLLGLSEAGVNVLDVQHVLGTSAGATVGAQITSGTSLETLFARQTEAGKQVDELTPDPAVVARLMTDFAEAAAGDGKTTLSQRMGRLALAAQTVPEAARRKVLEDRLPCHDWPKTRLTCVAIDALTGALAVFDKSSGVGLVEAVTASCAVPGVWPAVTINGRRYIDGGVRSPENADLMTGCGKILILSPLGKNAPFPGEQTLETQMAGLAAQGAGLFLIEPDAASREAIGRNPFDPATRAPAARAGRAQGRACGDECMTFWG